MARSLPHLRCTTYLLRVLSLHVTKCSRSSIRAICKFDSAEPFRSLSCRLDAVVWTRPKAEEMLTAQQVNLLAMEMLLRLCLCLLASARNAYSRQLKK